MGGGSHKQMGSDGRVQRAVEAGVSERLSKMSVVVSLAYFLQVLLYRIDQRLQPKQRKEKTS